MFNKNDEISIIIKEIKRLKREEAYLNRRAVGNAYEWKKGLEEKIPEKIHESLNVAFNKAFFLIFEKGSGIIEKIKLENKDEKQNFARACIMEGVGGKKAYREFRKGAKNRNILNTAVTTVEGAGLGALGIGLPDIALFIVMIIKGIYEISDYYNFDYTEPSERFFILKSMEAAMSKGEMYTSLNAGVDEMIKAFDKIAVNRELMEEQIEKTANSFAVDMIILKFIQGIPLAGIAGGAANPIIYNRVIKYIEIKYRKRFLREQLTEKLEI